MIWSQYIHIYFFIYRSYLFKYRSAFVWCPPDQTQPCVNWIFFVVPMDKIMLHVHFNSNYGTMKSGFSSVQAMFLESFVPVRSVCVLFFNFICPIEISFFQKYIYMFVIPIFVNLFFNTYMYKYMLQYMFMLRHSELVAQPKLLCCLFW